MGNSQASSNARTRITRRATLVRLAAITVAPLLGGIRPAMAAEPIEIGMAVALTGYLAQVDRQFVDGVKLAAKQLNDAGGIDGRMLELRILDNASNATTGVTITNQMLKQYNISAMLNGALSAQTLAILPIVARAEVPIIAVSQLPAEPGWAFLIGAAYQSTLETQLAFASQHLKVKRIAFLYGQTPYGQNGAKILSARAKAHGLEVVLSESVAATATDMTPQLARVKEANPDVLIDFSTGPLHIVQARAAATVGLQVPIVMAVDDTSVFSQASAVYKNCYCVVVPVQAFPQVNDAAVKGASESFLAAYKKAGLDPHGITGASWGWDAVTVLANAVRAAKSTSGKQLFAALEKAEVVGTTARYQFKATDHTGQASSNALSIAKCNGDKVEVIFTPRAV
jgi:branched-chain amino acid transport system substrate-binding protein